MNFNPVHELPRLLENTISSINPFSHQNRYTIILPSLALSLSLGYMGSLSFGSLGLIAGAGLGIVAGLVILCALKYFHTYQRIDINVIFLLDRVSQYQQMPPELLRSTQKIRQFVSSNPLMVEQSFQFHNFNRHLNYISSYAAEHEEIKQPWSEFLDGINGKSVRYPGDQLQQINVEISKNLLHKRQIHLQIERFDAQSNDFEKIMEHVLELDHECFARSEGLSKAVFKSLASKRSFFGLVAKDVSSDRVLGFLWGKTGRFRKGDFHIYAIGRKASASKLAIANQLMQRFVEFQDQTDKQARLEVRVSNKRAIDLYTKFGFDVKDVVRNYYTLPKENALVMTRSPRAALLF